MATKEVSITGDSPEAVAYILMQDVLAATGKLSSGLLSKSGLTEAELLALFTRCLNVAKGDPNSNEPARAAASREKPTYNPDDSP